MTDKELGPDPVSGLPVYLRNGPYGPYVQIGDPETKKPKRASLPKGTSASSLDLDAALGLLALPRDIEPHPETGDMIQAGLGRFGPYLNIRENLPVLHPMMTFLKSASTVLLIFLLKPPKRAGDCLARIHLAVKSMSKKAGSAPMSNITSFVPPWAKRMTLPISALKQP